MLVLLLFGQFFPHFRFALTDGRIAATRPGIAAEPARLISADALGLSQYPA